MPTNDVYIRDLPYEFLKKQPDGFFSSGKFSDHQELFKSKKASSPLLADKKNVKNIPEQVLTHLRVMLKNRYIRNSEVPVISDESVLMSFYYLQAVVMLNNDFKPDRKMLHPITARISEMKTGQPPVSLRRVLENPTLKRMRVKPNASVSPNDLATRPKKTSSPVKDIIASSKFYQANRSPLVFDDVLYSVHKMNKMISENGRVVGEPGWIHTDLSNGIIGSEDQEKYPYRNEGVKSMVSTVQSLVKERYNALTYDSMSVDLSNPGLLKDAMLAKLAQKRHVPPFRIIRLETINATMSESVYSFPIDDFSSSKFFIASVMNYRTGELDISPMLYQDTSTSSLKFSPKTGDEYSIFLIIGNTSNTFAVEQVDRKAFNIDQYEFKSPSKRWVIDMDGADDNFVFDVRGSSNLSPKSVKLEGDSKIIVDFEEEQSGIFNVISCARNWPDNCDLIVTEENIDRVLSSVNFFKKVYGKWTR